VGASYARMLSDHHPPASTLQGGETKWGAFIGADDTDEEEGFYEEDEEGRNAGIGSGLLIQLARAFDWPGVLVADLA
jgi:hypothetical protein